MLRAVPCWQLLLFLAGCCWHPAILLYLRLALADSLTHNQLLLRVSSYSTTTAMVFWDGPCWWPASYVSASADHPPYYDSLQIFLLPWLDRTIPVTMQRFSSLCCFKTYLLTEQCLNNILLLHAHMMDALNLTEIAHLCPLMQDRLNVFGNFVLFCV